MLIKLKKEKMKIKFTLIVLFMITLSVSQTQAQQKDYNSILKFSAANFVVNNFQLGLERKVAENQSIYLIAGYTYDKDNNWSTTEGLNLEIQYKYFAFESQGKVAKKRIYFAPYLGYKDFDYEETDFDYSNPEANTTNEFDIKAINAGIIIGITYILKERFVFDLYVGGGIRKTNDYDPDNLTYITGILEVGYEGIAPRVGLDVGITF